MNELGCAQSHSLSSLEMSFQPFSGSGNPSVQDREMEPMSAAYTSPPTSPPTSGLGLPPLYRPTNPLPPTEIEPSEDHVVDLPGSPRERMAHRNYSAVSRRDVESEMEGSPGTNRPVNRQGQRPPRRPGTRGENRNTVEGEGTVAKEWSSKKKINRMNRKTALGIEARTKYAEQKRDSLSKFVAAKFHQKMCKHHDPKGQAEKINELCKCGRKYDKLSVKTATWNTRENAREEPCNSYGEIAFKGFNVGSYKAPYIRVSDTAKPEAVAELMENHWGMDPPKLLVSITGGATKFSFHKHRITQLFQKGLTDIFTTSGVWIITSGNDSGLMQMVGKAVNDHVKGLGSMAKNKLVLLGIASWSSIAEREVLTADGPEGLFPAEYHRPKIPDGKKGVTSLEPNHTHFILVDDGRFNKFGAEIEWRAKFEKSLATGSLNDMDGGECKPPPVPSVTLLVNGGFGSIKASAESVDPEHSADRAPLVVIVGSGRAADVIVEVVQNLEPADLDEEMKLDADISRIYKTRMEVDFKSEKEKRDVLGYLKRILKMKDYVTAFDFIKHSGGSESFGLDNAILHALYANDGTRPVNRQSQLRLALEWDRVDYVQKEILNMDNKDYKQFLMHAHSLNNAAEMALLRNQHEFIHTFMDHGLELSQFVTIARLARIYRESSKTRDGYSRFTRNLITESILGRRIGGRQVSPADEDVSYLLAVGHRIQKLIGDFYPNEYVQLYSSTLEPAKSNFKFDDPAKHLFIWAVMFNKMDLAEVFWVKSQDHIGGAIVGASILRGLARTSNHQEGVDITASYAANALRFEAHGNEVLEKCWAYSRQMTSELLVREEPNWGKCTVMAMADNAEMEEFLAQPACFTKLNKIWRGDIALRVTTFHVVLFALMPLIGVFLLKFARSNDESRRLDEVDDDDDSSSDEEETDTEKRECVYKPVYEVHCCIPCCRCCRRGVQNKHKINYCRALLAGLRAPLVKFIYHALALPLQIFYLAFLTTHSIFVMTELSVYDSTQGFLSSIHGMEIATWILCFANLFEEIRQVAHEDEVGIGSKIRDWFADFWNKVDFLSYLLFITAVVLRFNLTPVDFQWARLVYCLALFLFFLRFGQMFYVLEEVGPKIIMIRKMMRDLVFFLAILGIFLVAYGVISQAMLYPNSSLNWQLLTSIFYKPYWQMYGELFLEEVVDGDVGSCIADTSLAAANSSLTVCPSQNPFSPWLLAIYMILTNVLLLNLLIAMFSYTFDQVQENADILWKYNYYSLVYENFDRPTLPILICPIIGTITSFIQKSDWCSPVVTGYKPKRQTLFRKRLCDKENERVTNFIRHCMDIYRTGQIRREREDINHKVGTTAERLEMVIEQLDDLRDDVMAKTDNGETEPDRITVMEPGQDDIIIISQRLSRVEDTMTRILNLVQAQSRAYERL